MAYVILVVFYLCTDPFFFYEHRPEGQVFIVLLLGRSEDILMARLLQCYYSIAVAQVLSSIKRPRTLCNASNLRLHRWMVWDGVDGKDISEKLKKYDVEME